MTSGVGMGVLWVKSVTLAYELCDLEQFVYTSFKNGRQKYLAHKVVIRIKEKCV